MELYFDNAATTPLLPEVREQLTAAFDIYGNPSSLHRLGISAEGLITEARKQVLAAAGVKQARLVFTGGGTEANNLAIFGYTRRFFGQPRHVVTTAIEHPSVLEAMRRLEKDGWRVSYIEPRSDGSIHADDVVAAVTDETVLVSVMHVNNETGERLPVAEIGRQLKQFPRIRYHIDGIQAFGKLPYAAEGTFADSYSLSGHKIGSPKGIGGLILLSQSIPEPLLYGGGQEQGLRSGTENVLGIAALGAAARSALTDTGSYERVQQLCQKLVDGLRAIPGCTVPARRAEDSPFIVNVSFPGLKGEPLVHALESKGLYVSTGSACSTRGGHVEASHVLQAQGRSAAEIESAIRFSLARWQTEDDVEQAIAICRKQVAWLQSLML